MSTHQPKIQTPQGINKTVLPKYYDIHIFHIKSLFVYSIRTILMAAPSGYDGGLRVVQQILAGKIQYHMDNGKF